MFDYVYTWIQNIAYYMVIITAALNVIPGREYKKYVRFYTGLVLIIVMAGPIMKLGGIEEDFYRMYRETEVGYEADEIEEELRCAGRRILSFISAEEETENKKKTIKVEEIQIDP